MTASLSEVLVIMCQVRKHHIPGDMSVHQHWCRTSNLAHFKMYTGLWVWMVFLTSEYQVYRPRFGEKMYLWLQSSKVYVKEYAEFLCGLVLQWHRYGWFCVMMVFVCIIFKEYKIFYYLDVTPSMYNFVNVSNCGCRFLWTFGSWMRCSLQMMVLTTVGILTVGCSESRMMKYNVIFSRVAVKHMASEFRELPTWITFYWGMFISCLLQKFYAKWTSCWFVEYTPCNKVMNVATAYWQWGNRIWMKVPYFLAHKTHFFFPKNVT